MIKELKKDVKKYGLKVVIIGTLLKLLLFTIEELCFIWFVLDVLKKL